MFLYYNFSLYILLHCSVQNLYKYLFTSTRKPNVSYFQSRPSTFSSPKQDFVCGTRNWNQKSCSILLHWMLPSGAPGYLLFLLLSSAHSKSHSYECFQHDMRAFLWCHSFPTMDMDPLNRQMVWRTGLTDWLTNIQSISVEKKKLESVCLTNNQTLTWQRDKYLSSPPQSIPTHLKNETSH